jgi:hypothetical protein
MTEEDHGEVVAVIKRYLAAKHCTLYGQFFNIKDDGDKGIEEAAVWLAGEIEAVHEFMEDEQRGVG